MSPRPRPQFLRFITDRRDPDSHVAQGPFAVAYTLRDEGLLELHERTWFAETVGWFEKHLRVPKRAELTLPWYSREHGRVVFWFKMSARESIQRMRQLATMLRHHGVATRTLRAARPGRIVYEDDAQVGAIPFRDGPR